MNRYAVSQGVLRSGQLATDALWAAGAGAAAVGLDARSLHEHGTDAVTATLAGHGLRVSSIFGALDPILELTPPSDALAHADAAISSCADLGGVGLLVTTGPLEDRSIARADRACQTWLAATAPRAEEAGVLLLLEPVHPLLRHVSYVHSLRHAAELSAGLPGTGLLADVGHLWWDRAVLDDISDLVDHIGLVQIDDVDGDELILYNYRRTQLGDGVIPLPELVAALEASGYEGLYENESIAKVPRDARQDFVTLGGQRLAAWLDRE